MGKGKLKQEKVQHFTLQYRAESNFYVFGCIFRFAHHKIIEMYL